MQCGYFKKKKEKKAITCLFFVILLSEITCLSQSIPMPLTRETRKFIVSKCCKKENHIL